MATALITGITGQDGSLMADLLLSKGYTVIGMSRRRSGGGDWRIKHLYDDPDFFLEFGDVTDSGSISRLIDSYGPDEFFNFAAQSFVGVSWKEPEHTMNVTGLGPLRCLEAIRNVKPDTRFYQASSSETFGRVREIPQNENTPFYPRSPYGVAKVTGYWTTINYRESYGIHASNGILFNHEGSRRGIEFVTRKITDGVAKIKLGLQDKLSLGNLDSCRDWGDARDYVRAAWLMLQQNSPDDYVIATGRARSIREFLYEAFSYVDLDWREHVVQDPKFMRPAEVDILVGDASKAKKKLGWVPEISFSDMVREMVDEDLRRLNNGLRR